MDPKELRKTTLGGAVLRGFGAAVGAFVAVAAIMLLFVAVVNPWLDTVKGDATEMFGPAEGWMVFFATVLLAPPTVVAAAWIGLRSAQRRWSMNDVTPKAWQFILAGVPLALLMARIAGATTEWALIPAVPVGFGLAGFLVSTSLRAPSADWPPPSTQPVQTPTR